MNHSKIERIAQVKGYKVSLDGKTVTRKGRVIRAHLNRGGYYRFGINGKDCRVHRLQAFQKFGEFIYLPGIMVRHLDNNPQNNHHENLALGDRSQNTFDLPERWRIAKASHPKYNHAAIIEHCKTNSRKSAMERFGVSSGQLTYILNHSIAAVGVPNRPCHRRHPHPVAA